MKYLKLGNTDLERLAHLPGLHDLRRTGTAAITPGRCRKRAAVRCWKQALGIRYQLFSTPPTAIPDGSSEEILGRALHDHAPSRRLGGRHQAYFPLSNLKRGLSRANIMQSIDDSLRRLGTDYVDLLQIHRWDYETPLEETLEALHDVVKAGKARYIGASSMYAWRFAKALYTADLHGWTRFVSMQDQYNLIQREEGAKCIRCVPPKASPCCRGARWRAAA